MDFTEHLSINFQVRQVAPTSVTYDPKSGKNKVNIRLPCKYRRGGIMGVIDHEIGTHFLRRYNERPKFGRKSVKSTKCATVFVLRRVLPAQTNKCETRLRAAFRCSIDRRLTTIWRCRPVKCRSLTCSTISDNTSTVPGPGSSILCG